MRPSWDATWMAVAEVVGRRSVCARRQIGAVLVDPSNRPVATGYNGPPAGFLIERDSNCTAFCPRAQRASQSVLDSPTAELIRASRPPQLPGKTYDDCYTVHAELNALVFADRRDYAGGTLYVTSVPCWDCGKIVANSGVKRVVTQLDQIQDAHRDPDRTLQFLDDCGLEFLIWEG